MAYYPRLTRHVVDSNQSVHHHMEYHKNDILSSVPRRQWKEQEIESIMRGEDETLKKLLYRYSPFDEAFANSINASILQTSVSEINWHTYLPTILGSTDPIITADAISAESWKRFQEIPFRSWVRSSLNLEDKTLDSLVLCHERLLFHIYSYLRTHIDKLPWVVRVAKARSSLTRFYN